MARGSADIRIGLVTGLGKPARLRGCCNFRMVGKCSSERRNKGIVRSLETRINQKRCEIFTGQKPQAGALAGDAGFFKDCRGF
jgi:hypothetical protein